MKLDKKKQLAAKTLGTGKRKIIFDESRLSEIKEAITKQDIRDLKKTGAIRIRETKGRRKVRKRKTKRGAGGIKINVKKRKEVYVRITRKLRSYIKALKENKKIDHKTYRELRKKIKARGFKSKAQLKEYLKTE
ncbi:hypothetical protein A3K73_09200 [Candidatus Pacearchaeota archaeon RBG_13_36_9]|nr:MAG: hypothetical protein A3K73_09200 [Candidatus Pacearchaeota archaeon RBG_13_36_9]